MFWGGAPQFTSLELLSDLTLHVVSPGLFNTSLYMEGEPMTCHFVGTRSEREGGGVCIYDTQSGIVMCVSKCVCTWL